MFNNARADFYGKTDWSNGYPAATGIGANLGGILVDLDAAVFARSECYATPIDNKLQIARPRLFGPGPRSCPAEESHSEVRTGQKHDFR